jgi:hypothetical protein
MTARRAALAALALLLLAGLVWLLRTPSAVPAESEISNLRSQISNPSPQISDLRSQISDPKPPPPPEAPSELARDLNSPATDIQADLRLVLDVLGTFRSNFPRDGNPTGSNAEITAALTGQNKLRLALLPPRHPAINGAGELCDRWGTPFFFHAESATRMEIRSAGPDRTLWTPDDVHLAP